MSILGSGLGGKAVGKVFARYGFETLKALYEELEQHSFMNFQIFITKPLLAVATSEYVLTIDPEQLRKII